MNKKAYNIGDEVAALSTPMVDASKLGFFDDLEDACYDLFCSYCEKLGIDLSYPGPDDCIDFYIAKEIQGRILDIFTECGIQINYNNDLQERRFIELTNKIETLKAELVENTFSKSNSEKYETIRQIGGLVLERDNIYGTDLKENCFIASDNELYNEIIGFMADETPLKDSEGTPLRIGDTITLYYGTDREYDRTVFNGLVSQKMIDGTKAVKTADFCDYESINNGSAGLTITNIDCKEYFLQCIQNQSEAEETGMSL